MADQGIEKDLIWLKKNCAALLQILLLNYKKSLVYYPSVKFRVFPFQKKLASSTFIVLESGTVPSGGDTIVLAGDTVVPVGGAVRMCNIHLLGC